MAGTSVALSGGGHRAGLFALGVLLYLTDAQQNLGVTSISSVSGGSITNGYVARSLDFTATDGVAFRTAMAPLARALASTGTFQSGIRPRPIPLIVVTVLVAILTLIVWSDVSHRWVGVIVLAALACLAGWLWLGRTLRTAVGQLYGAIVVPSAAAALLLPCALPGHGSLWLATKMVLGVFLFLAWVEWMLGLRGWLCRHCYRRNLFPDETRLGGLNRTVDHIFCATEIQTGDHFYLSPKFAYGYLLGVGTAAEIDLVSAVQASTALPGAFPPRRLASASLDFAYPSPAEPPNDARPQPFPRWLHLVDGGVYDNMAEQWGVGFARRAQRWPALNQLASRPERLIVVNASTGAPFWRMPSPWLPGLTELRALIRDSDIMYEQTTAQRRLALVDRFEAALLTGKGLPGALVHIGQSPYRVPALFEHATGALAARAARAGAALVALHASGVTRAQWDDVARDNAAVTTALAPLGREVSARILWHAYVLAMVNLHVILDFPLHPIPDRHAFGALVGG